MKRTNEQTELRDLLRRFLEEHVTAGYLKQRIESGKRRDTDLLATCSQLGLVEGFSSEPPVLSFVDLAIVAEECGRVLLPEAITERILGAFVIPTILPENERAVYRSGLNGATEIALAPPSCCDLKVTPSMDRITGEITWAWGVEGASVLLAFTSAANDRCAVLVNLNGPGVTVSAVPSLDLTSALSKVHLNDAPVVLLSVEVSALIEDVAGILKACEVAGICSRVVEMTVAYVSTREQFGVPVGGFQAIQQKLADAYATAESLGALCRFAAWSVVNSPSQRSLTASAAALRAADIGPKVCEAALQCHGGIGFTWEYELHLYLRRAKAMQAAYMLTDTRARELLADAVAGS